MTESQQPRTSAGDPVAGRGTACKRAQQADGGISVPAAGAAAAGSPTVTTTSTSTSKQRIAQVRGVASVVWHVTSGRQGAKGLDAIKDDQCGSEVKEQMRALMRSDDALRCVVQAETEEAAQAAFVASCEEQQHWPSNLIGALTRKAQGQVDPSVLGSKARATRKRAATNATKQSPVGVAAKRAKRGEAMHRALEAPRDVLIKLHVGNLRQDQKRVSGFKPKHKKNFFELLDKEDRVKLHADTPADVRKALEVKCGYDPSKVSSEELDQLVNLLDEVFRVTLEQQQLEDDAKVAKKT
ncbi:unnamed protein product, partial [Durusdinium trenchii]